MKIQMRIKCGEGMNTRYSPEFNHPSHFAIDAADIEWLTERGGPYIVQIHDATNPTRGDENWMSVGELNGI